jgi:hypothetical protein
MLNKVANLLLFSTKLSLLLNVAPLPMAGFGASGFGNNSLYVAINLIRRRINAGCGFTGNKPTVPSGGLTNAFIRSLQKFARTIPRTIGSAADSDALPLDPMNIRFPIN